MTAGIIIALVGAFVIGHVVWGDWLDKVLDAGGLS